MPWFLRHINPGNGTDRIRELENYFSSSNKEKSFRNLVIGMCPSFLQSYIQRIRATEKQLKYIQLIGYNKITSINK